MNSVSCEPFGVISDALRYCRGNGIHCHLFRLFPFFSRSFLFATFRRCFSSPSFAFSLALSVCIGVGIYIYTHVLYMCRNVGDPPRYSSFSLSFPSLSLCPSLTISPFLAPFFHSLSLSLSVKLPFSDRGPLQWRFRSS